MITEGKNRGSDKYDKAKTLPAVYDGRAVMSERTQEDALRAADELVGQALNKVETRCRVLAYYIQDCERKCSLTAAWSEAVRELRALHDDRGALLLRRSLIQQALECPVNERSAQTVLVPAQDRAPRQAQQQLQIRRR
jgi:hypothetical protein